jgi:hypothetical protein
VRHRLRAEDEHTIALSGDGKSPSNFAVYLDCPMRTSLEALPAANARLILDLEQQRLIRRHRNGIGGADADARQAGDTELGVNDKIQGWSVRGGELVAI